MYLSCPVTVNNCGNKCPASSIWMFSCALSAAVPKAFEHTLRLTSATSSASMVQNDSSSFSVRAEAELKRLAAFRCYSKR